MQFFLISSNSIIYNIIKETIRKLSFLIFFFFVFIIILFFLNQIVILQNKKDIYIYIHTGCNKTNVCL